MVTVQDILEDTQRSSYITMISGDNKEKYFVRTVPDIYKFAHVRTIVYKRYPDNPVAVEVLNKTHEGRGYIKTCSHDPVVYFIAQNFDNLDNIHFQED